MGLQIAKIRVISFISGLWLLALIARNHALLIEICGSVFFQQIPSGLFQSNLYGDLCRVYLYLLYPIAIFLIFQIKLNWSAALAFLGIALFTLRHPFFIELDLNYFGWVLFAISLHGIPISYFSQITHSILQYIGYIVFGVGFFCSAIGKLSYPSWVHGNAIHEVLNGETSRHIPYINAFFASSSISRIANYYSLFIEFFFIFGIFYQRTRKAMILMAMFFQLSMLVLLNITEINLSAFVFLLYIYPMNQLGLLKIIAALVPPNPSEVQSAL